MTTTNMKVIPIFIYNIIYFLQFVARMIVIAIMYPKNSESNEIYTIDRIAVYSDSVIIILSLTIVTLLLHLYYKSIKQRRNDFLARY